MGDSILYSERRLLTWISKVNWLPIAGVAVALWLPLKLLRVAHGELSTALAILDASNKSTILYGLGVLLVPTALAVLWAAATFTAAVAVGRIRAASANRVTDSQARESFLRLVMVAIPWAVLTWLLVVVAPWRSLPVVIPLVAAFALWIARRQGREYRDPRIPAWATKSPSRFALLVAGVVAGLTFLIADQVFKEPLSDRMWLAPALMDDSPSTRVKVYVLHRGPSEVTVLVDKPRYVVARPTTTRLRPCVEGATEFGPSLFDMMSHSEEPPLPSCDAPSRKK